MKLADLLRRRRVRVLSSPNYQTVIEVNMPIRFYWNLDGTFDGLEFGDGKAIQTADLIPIHRILIEISNLVGKK